MRVRATSGEGLMLAIGLVALALTGAEVASRYQPHTWIQRDGRFYVNVSTTLVERLSLDQGEFAASWYSGTLGWNRNLDASWSNIALGRGDVRLPKHPVLLPLLSTPLFWAFGLHGTLWFNVLAFGLIAGLAFAVARRYASEPAAALAALSATLGSGLRLHAYDYHVDILNLVLFLGAFELLHRRRGLSAGVLLGGTVILKPTSLLWLPCFALWLLGTGERRTLVRGLIGGAATMAAYAASNLWLFGRPWWAGYNRTLVVVDGEPQVVANLDAFSVPWREGFQALWSGPWGVRHRLPLFGLSLLGLAGLRRRRPWYVLAAALAVVLSVVVFARYRWYGDRFLWPSAALLVPALAVAFERLGGWARHFQWPVVVRHALMIGFGGAILLGLHAAVGPPLAARLDGGGLETLAYRCAAAALLFAALYLAAKRVDDGPLAAAAPFAFALLPGVLERLLGADLDVAACFGLAVAVALPRPWMSLVAALVVAVGATVLGPPGDATALVDRSFTGDGRAAWVLLPVWLVALPLARANAWRLGAPLLLLVPSLAGVGEGRWPLFVLAAFALALPVAAGALGDRLVDRWRALSVGGRWVAVAAPLLALLAIGAVARLSPSRFRIATFDGVRTADVFLGDIPCDFLAWEHLNWECATFDRGVHGQTGLATSDPLRVRGDAAGLFLISTGGRSERRVRWEGVPRTGTFRLRYAVADQLRGGGTLEVRVDDEVVLTEELSRDPDGAVRIATADVPGEPGQPAVLELVLRGTRVGVGVDGGFVE